MLSILQISLLYCLSRFSFIASIAYMLSGARACACVCVDLRMRVCVCARVSRLGMVIGQSSSYRQHEALQVHHILKPRVGYLCLDHTGEGALLGRCAEMQT
jgi:hypothetical protein